MADLAGHLTNRGGSLYFAHTSTLWFEPVERTLLWRLGEERPDLEGCPAVAEQHQLTVAGLPAQPALPRSAADLVEERPVPPPRTRLDTRWRDGRWQRLTSRGWK